MPADALAECKSDWPPTEQQASSAEPEPSASVYFLSRTLRWYVIYDPMRILIIPTPVLTDGYGLSFRYHNVCMLVPVPVPAGG
eukprot:55063-Rhodomonas_salina.2